MEKEGIGTVRATVIAALVLFVGLFLPLFTVRYAPPGGWGTVDGHQVGAFAETVSGWQFVTSAHWTEVLFTLGLLGLPVVALLAWGSDATSVLSAVKAGMALCGVALAAGCLLVLGLGLLASPMVMPTGGEGGVLAALHADPFASGYQRVAAALGLNSMPTPYLFASFGAGWFAVAAALAVTLGALWRWTAEVAMFIVAVAVLLRFTDPALLASASGWIFPAGS